MNGGNFINRSVKHFRKYIAAGLISIMLTGLCACNMSDNTYLMPYSDKGSDDMPAPSDMLIADKAASFAENLAVISVDATTGNEVKDALEDVDATEIFLTGTTDAKVISAYNIYKTMPPASLTKILTSLVALRSGIDLDQTFTLTDDVIISIADAQVCGFKPGDEISLRTLLYCTLIYSGNDAANAVASAVSGGDIAAFCEEMNTVARSLGATQTNFVTPNGLDDPNHYTTAYDLYLIFNECLKYDVFRDAIAQSGYTAKWQRDGSDMSQYYESTNYYLIGNKDAPDGVNVIGGKTGTTDKAGLCLILYVTDKDDNGYISVLLGSPDKDTLYQSMSNLLSDINK